MTNILSFNGGGVRGAYSSEILRRVVAEYPDLLPKTHFISGTSTGGIIALLLASGASPSDVVNLYIENMDRIFKKGPLHPLTSGFGLWGPKYNNKHLRKCLEKKFGNTMIGQFPFRVGVMVVKLVMCENGKYKWTPMMLHNGNGITNDSHVLAVDAAMGTSACPTMFSSWKGMIDGGIASNNPSSVSIGLVMDENSMIPSVKILEDIRVLSFGCGDWPDIKNDHDLEWGVAQWSTKIISLLLDSNASRTDLECSTLLEDRYMKINPFCEEISDINLDDADGVFRLISAAKALDISPVIDWLKYQQW